MSMFVTETPLFTLAGMVIEACAAASLRVTTAESCTGGLVASTLTAIPGASDVLERGFVTYSNAAKTELLGVPAEVIETHGAVSESVARRMATGARQASHADVAVAVTGVAGPGGTATKPEGLVHFACVGPGTAEVHQEVNFGPIGRNRVREKSVEVALTMILSAVQSTHSD